jgi:hypothetical protein
MYSLLSIPWNFQKLTLAFFFKVNFNKCQEEKDEELFSCLLANHNRMKVGKYQNLQNSWRLTNIFSEPWAREEIQGGRK